MSWLDEDKPWYVFYSGEMRGPMSPRDALKLAGDGKLAATDLVWTVGFPEWCAAGEVQGLYRPPPLPPGLAKTLAQAATGAEDKRARPPTAPPTEPADAAGVKASERPAPTDPPSKTIDTTASVIDRSRSAATASGQATDVKAVLQALLNDQESESSLPGNRELGAGLRKEGLMDQIVKKIRDQELLQPGSGLSQAKPVRSKGS